MSLILKNAVKQVDEKSKSYFVDKLKEYDYLIDEKEKKLSVNFGLGYHRKSDRLT